MKILLIIIIACVQCSLCQRDPIVTIQNIKRLLGEEYQFPIRRHFVKKYATLLSKSLSAGQLQNQGRNYEEEGLSKVRYTSEDEDGFMEQQKMELENHLQDVTAGDGNVGGTSDTCLNHTQGFIAGVGDSATWALQMLDAFGKPGSDILRGDLGWVGSFDECLAVTTPQNVSFRSTYCRATLVPANQHNNSMLVPPITSLPITINLGLCLPDTCSYSDVTNIITDVLNSTNISLVPSVSCYKRDYPLDTPAIVAIVICSFFACLVLLGTGYDVIIFQIPKGSGFSGTKPSSRNYGSTSHNIHTNITDDKTPLMSDLHQSEDGQHNRDNDLKQKQHIEAVGEKQTSKPGLGSQILLSFSVYTNGAKILNTKQPPGSLTAVHGIRFLSMTWVMLGHVFAYLPSESANVLPYFQSHINRWEFAAILNGLLSVDTFFTLSGLLVTYLTLKEMKKGGGKLNWFMFYFHRFWRLTPVYMVMLMVFVCLFHYFSDGPFWYQTGIQTETCRDYWWTNLLYINNLVHRDNQCFSWGWYLANDMQFYVLSPLILIPLFYSEILGQVVLGLFLAATMTTAGLISRLNNLPAGYLYAVQGKTGPDTYTDYYMTPYCRMGPYLAGMMAGYILYKGQGKLRMNKITVTVGWMMAAASALAVVYGPYDSANGTPMPSDVGAFYNAVHRTVWGAAVSWVVVACATGSGGFVNTMLSWSAFVPLSRLTYSIYLSHPMIISLVYMSQRTMIYLTDITIVCSFLGILVISYGVAWVVSLIFEAPMMGLERALLRRERRN